MQFSRGLLLVQTCACTHTLIPHTSKVKSFSETVQSKFKLGKKNIFLNVASPIKIPLVYNIPLSTVENLFYNMPQSSSDLGLGVLPRGLSVRGGRQQPLSPPMAPRPLKGTVSHILPIVLAWIAEFERGMDQLFLLLVRNSEGTGFRSSSLLLINR